MQRATLDLIQVYGLNNAMIMVDVRLTSNTKASRISLISSRCFFGRRYLSSFTFAQLSRNVNVNETILAYKSNRNLVRVKSFPRNRFYLLVNLFSILLINYGQIACRIWRENSNKHYCVCYYSVSIYSQPL